MPIFLLISSIIGAVALVPLSCFFCCGFMGILGFQQEKAARKKLQEADQLWAAGKKSEAVAQYKSVVEDHSSIIPVSDRPTVYQRVVEFEIEHGNTSYAKRLIEMAVARDVLLSFTSPTARQLLVEVQRVREDRQLAEAKRKQEEDRERKQSDFSWDAQPKSPPNSEPKKSGDGGDGNKNDTYDAGFQTGYGLGQNRVDLYKSYNTAQKEHFLPTRMRWR